MALKMRPRANHPIRNIINFGSPLRRNFSARGVGQRLIVDLIWQDFVCVAVLAAHSLATFTSALLS